MQEKREDKSRHSGIFQKTSKGDKSGKSVSSTPVESSDSNQHIRRQMEELKQKLDSLDRGE